MAELKRTQNSLLNISRLPPEILGDIFCRSVIPDGFEKRSCNFLLVCHHWFEVASCTPELRGFWGNNLRDWEKRHLRYTDIPLDLILDGSRFMRDTLDGAVRDSLRTRSSRDSIRRIHLRARDWRLLSNILFPLTANRKEVRYNSVESFILRNEGNTPFDISRYFTYNRSRKLQHLELTNCTISSWDCLTSQTALLTTLVLHLSDLSPHSNHTPTILNTFLQPCPSESCTYWVFNPYRWWQKSLSSTATPSLGGTQVGWTSA